MKFAATITLLCCVATGFSAPARDVRVVKFSFFGKEYVRLDQWASANSFQWKWLSKNEAVVWNGSTKMQFTAESKRISINGTTVLLSEPVLNQNGVPQIAGIDLTTALNPLLF